MNDSCLTLVENGVVRAAISAPVEYAWLAEELRTHLRRLTGAELPIGEGDGARIVLGGPAVNPLAARAEALGVVSFALSGEAFLIESASLDGRPCLFLAGRDERATMYAVYEFLERCGIVFHLTGDVIPEIVPTLRVDLHVRRAPEIARRGLHMRHFVMPWMGLEEFRRMIDQMAKMKMNYLEFYWYVGGPWIEFSHRGEAAKIGDLYHEESGYTAWRIETYGFSHDDVVIGRECFTDRKPCAPEFQGCRTPADAFRVAGQLLHEMIAYAHARHIAVWLGTGDCPSVPPNLANHCRPTSARFLDAPVIPPGDPAGLEIWQAMLDSMVQTYPEADGYWVWLAELYFHDNDGATRETVARYNHLRSRIPSKTEIMAMGYDVYVEALDETALVEGDLGLLHYGTALAEHFTARYPDRKFGVSLLGRAYLLPALDAALPPGVALQSMEACICWNRTSRVPMEPFGAVRNRETFLVPRLDDDTNEFAIQYNLGIYAHDRALAGGKAFGLAGIAPQMGRTRGAEHNARYLADGGWETALTPEAFYARYLGALYGPAAGDVCRAYALLEDNEWRLSSMGLDAKHSRWVFEGFNNFLNYNDSADINYMKAVRDPAKPPAQDLRDSWAYRREAFTAAVVRLDVALDHLRRAAHRCPAGARGELAYVTGKTMAFRLFLRGLIAFMESLLALCCDLPRAESCIARATGLLEATARAAAACADHPTDSHILFRFNVRVLLPMREFAKHVRNLARGEEIEAVDWKVIAP